jgi:3-methyladenine DNA glycosylase/8-oxoguanine DNA glycosylase
VLEALGRLGAVPAGVRSPAARARASRAAAELADGWRPWRSYAVQHLWASLEEAGKESAPPLGPPDSRESIQSREEKEDRS